MQKAILIERIKELTKPLTPLPADHEVHLSPIADIRCVALDFYGTMFISGVGDIGVDEEQESSSEQTFIEALSDSGFDINTEAAGQTGLQVFELVINEFIQRKRNSGIDYPEPDIVKIWQDVLTNLKEQNFIDGNDGRVSREAAIRFGVEFEFRVNAIWPNPNLVRTLTTLREHDIMLGIISNSQFYTPLAFEALLGKAPSAFGFDEDLLVWSYAAGLKKPSLSFYQLFADKLPAKNIKPEEVLYVGNDLIKDVIPANKIGMKTALYVGDSRSIRHEDADLQESDKHRPDLVIDDLAQLTECVG